MLSHTFSVGLRSFAIWGSAVAAILLINSGLLFASEKTKKTALAEQLVREALHREIYGQDQERQQLLQQALEQSPDYAPAKWAQGYVRYQDRWIKVEKILQVRKEDGRFEAYEKERGKYSHTIKDQLALADWCREQELYAQERAHLTQVLALDPNHAAARKGLGFRRVRGAWLNSEEVQQELKQRKEDQEALARWRPEMESIRNGLTHSSNKIRNKASDRIRAITEVSAIPALEAVLSRLNEPTAQLVVETIGDMSDNRAALSLARQAVNSPWENIRKRAAQQLRSRPKETYVPALLSAMYSPVKSKLEVSRDSGGRIMVRHQFIREGQNENQQLVLNAEYRRFSLTGGDREGAPDRALIEAAFSSHNRNVAMNQQNRRTKALNERIIEVLQTAVGEEHIDNPQGWWQWWIRHNEFLVQGKKQTRTLRQSQQHAVTDRAGLTLNHLRGQILRARNKALREQYAGPQNIFAKTWAMRKFGFQSCLVAGTPVWTTVGAVAIEKVQIGDLVLPLGLLP